MSDSVPQPPGPLDDNTMAQLAARLDELQRHVQGLDLALKRSKSTRQIVALAFLIFVVVAGWRFYALGDSIRTPKYQQRLMTELQKSVQSNQDEFSREAQRLVDGVIPVVQTAFAEQSQKDLPLFMQVIEEERSQLLDRLLRRLSTTLETHHHELVSKYERMFAEEFPTLQNPETRSRMVGNICLALDRLVQKYYVKEYQKEFQTLDQTWADFPAADVPDADDPPLDSQLVGELMELLAVKFARRHTPEY